MRTPFLAVVAGVLAAAAVVIVAVVVFTGGDGGADTLHSEAGFKARVTGAVLAETDLDAEPGFGLKVHVTHPESDNWVDLPLQQSYARYRREPADEDEILSGLVRQAEERLSAGIGDASFAEVRENVLPLLKRRPAVRGLPEEPAARRTVGDLLIVFAVQTNDQFTLVSVEDAERWGRPLPALERLALANLYRQTQQDEPLLCEPAETGKLCGWASSDGYDAARMLVPRLRRQIERELGGPAVYAVPQERVFVALPRRLAERIRAQVLRDFTRADDPVSSELFVEQRGQLAVLPARRLS